MDEILRYFPELTPTQTERFMLLDALYREWNEKINVISRRDIDNLYVNHVLHSLSIARFFTPVSGTTFMDLGTGGGFPGIPLAILWPDCNFHLIDRIGKKIKVASAIAEAAGLENITFQHGDSGECHRKFDYVVSRAVMALPELVKACRGNIAPGIAQPASQRTAVSQGWRPHRGALASQQAGGRCATVRLVLRAVFRNQRTDLRKSAIT